MQSRERREAAYIFQLQLRVRCVDDAVLHWPGLDFLLYLLLLVQGLDLLFQLIYVDLQLLLLLFQCVDVEVIFRLEQLLRAILFGLQLVVLRVQLFVLV